VKSSTDAGAPLFDQKITWP